MNLGFQTKLSVCNFAKQYLKKYCEHFSIYKQFCLRINKLAPFFSELCNAELKAKPKTSKTHLLDSAPVIAAKRSHSSKAETAFGLRYKGYCPSKRMWYYGVKIHVLAEERLHSTPDSARKFLLRKRRNTTCLQANGCSKIPMTSMFSQTKPTLTTANALGMRWFPVASKLSPFSAKFRGLRAFRMLLSSALSKDC